MKTNSFGFYIPGPMNNPCFIRSTYEIIILYVSFICKCTSLGEKALGNLFMFQILIFNFHRATDSIKCLGFVGRKVWVGFGKWSWQKEKRITGGPKGETR